MGRWILKEAAEQLKKWENDSEKKEWRISVNISHKQFERGSFIPLIDSLIKEYAINPNKLRLELTENLLIKNTEETLDKIKKLNEMGITLSIDDFGTGYSSLAYLKQLSIHELKIDQSVAHNGICLTVVKIENKNYTVTAIKETIDKMIERLNYDIIYLENMSIFNDIKILIYTFETILRGKGI